MEHCIIYFSSSVILFQEADLSTLLERSRRNNAALGITGVLLINRGSIIQVLEGSMDAIKPLYERIERDRRHTNVIKVFEEPISQRLFTDWRMDCKTISAHQLEITQTMASLHNADWLSKKPGRDVILSMIKIIYDGLIW